MTTAPISNLSVIYLVLNPPLERLAAQVEYMREVADEFIFVVDDRTDTETVSIMQSWPGAVIVPFTWIDDFSAARNAALPFVTKAWTLHLDPDELPSFKMMRYLKQVTLYPEPSEGIIAHLFWTPNWWGGKKGEEHDYHWHIRLWLSGHGQFYRSVHELVMLDGLAEEQTRWGIARRAPEDARLIHSKAWDQAISDQDYYESLGERSM